MKNKKNDKKHHYFKLNEDDILEIVCHHLADQEELGTYNSKLTFIDEGNDDLRIVAAFGELEDESITELDLFKLDKEIDYNGDHANIPEGCNLDPTNPETREKVKKLLDKIKNGEKIF
ncbi:hypothetical protein [Viridibacillus arvi]|uniref:Uncharacterized protein n=1 Tax=Viridibacillus arvi TaxID=263475 RepID=A0A0M0LLP1_9BACL|nr:hypothetical protein [Viridibacillus arvi]KOO51633.1 hypothetical protein AMD00_03995 [Viridibacillus arvi]